MKQIKEVNNSFNVLLKFNITLEPTGSPKLIIVSSHQTKSHGKTLIVLYRIIEYIVIISNNSITYNLNITERYVIVNNAIFCNVYNICVAGVYSIGGGLFSDPVEENIGTGMNYYNSFTKHCLL